MLQIKPQLERLLRLPPDALTKEIALTQSLLELFIARPLADQPPRVTLSFVENSRGRSSKHEWFPRPDWSFTLP